VDLNTGETAGWSDYFTITATQTAYLDMTFTSSGWGYSSNYWDGTMYLKFSNSGWRWDAPEWDDCGGSLILEGGYGIGEVTCFYPTDCWACTRWGLDVDPSCTSAKIEVTADLEKPSYGIISVKTDQAGSCASAMSFANVCWTTSKTFQSSCLSSSGKTEISVCHEDTYSWGDYHAAIRRVRITFNGWMVPVGKLYQGSLEAVPASNEQ
jgi:hypothetical protein